MKKLTPQGVYKLYDKGVQFNTQIGLYDTITKNENFFIGKQWEGVESNGLPTPVFNFLKRVTLFQIATISSDNISMQATPLSSTSEYSLGDLEQIADVMNKQFAELFERNKVVTKVREFMRNAAVDGDGATYSWFDPDMETGQDAKGGIVTEIIENNRVIFGNPNDKHVQEQPWIIIPMRKQVDYVKKLAEKNGVKKEDIETIQPDETEYTSQMDQLTDDRVTLLLYFYKNDDTGTVWSMKCTRNLVIEKEKDTQLKLYPLTWMNWDYVQDCYHGQALISQLLPNQIFVNKLFAMSMISLMTTAYPKIIYDKTRVPRWDSRVGAAIGINGGDMNTVAKIMDPATISPQVSQFIDLAVNYTQNFMGASDAALGDTRPDNTSAIVALQRASNAPLELVKLNMYECIEDLGRIYLDMMRAYYGRRYVQVKMLTKDELSRQPLGMNLQDSDVNTPFDFSILNKIPMSLKLDVGASAYWSEIMTVQTLDNLLMNGKLDLVDYLERIPEGYVSKRQELIEKLKGMQASMTGGGTNGQILDMSPEIPVEGGSGYGQLQRALNETGVV
uniref:Portal protein n=1 Tax=Myoviridae sp. ctxZR60 TaxID=2826712 RepID=A0A8S5MW85_9CAUD|nr:MAG TPA: portal protein [Myoviridae sp. ctxZR60]